MLSLWIGETGDRRTAEFVGRMDTILARDTAPIVLRLEPSPRIEGRVVNPRGEPVGGAEVRAIRTDPSWRSVEGAMRSRRTGTDGRFGLTLRPGTWSLEVLAGVLGRERVDEIEARSDQVVDLGDIVVRELALLVGHVRTSAGDPIAGARVMVGSRTREERYGSAFYHTEVITDAEGRFALGLEDGEYSVRASLGGYVDPEPRTVVHPGAGSIEFVLEPKPEPCRVRGHVSLDGQQVEGARVRIATLREGTGSPGFHFGFGGPTYEPRRGEKHWDETTESWEDTTDHRGEFEIETRRDGALALKVIAHGPGFAHAASRELEMPPDGDLEGVVVEALPGSDLILVTRTPERRPVARAEVRIASTERRPGMTLGGRTDRDGRVLVPRLPAGRYRVVVWPEDARGGPGITRDLAWSAESPEVIEIRLDHE